MFTLRAASRIVMPFFVSTSIPFMVSLTVSMFFIFRLRCSVSYLSFSSKLPCVNDCPTLASQYTRRTCFRLAWSAAIFNFLSMFFGYRGHQLIFKVNHHGSRFQDALGTSFYAFAAAIALVRVNADKVLSRAVLVAVMNNQVINSSCLFMKIDALFRREPWRKGRPLSPQQPWDQTPPSWEGL